MLFLLYFNLVISYSDLLFVDYSNLLFADDTIFFFFVESLDEEMNLKYL